MPTPTASCPPRFRLARRALLVLCGLAGLGLAGHLAPAGAQDAGRGDEATRFVQHLGNQLVAVVNGSASAAQKRADLQRLVDGAVDVDRIAQFCLGSFWNTATPEQQRKFTALFHQVLINNVTGHLGEYAGVSFVMTSTEERGGAEYVGTIVRRPNNPPANVQWVVSYETGSPKIVDVQAEGTSLRLTQRDDYLSYLRRHNGSVDALIAAMQRQTAAANAG